MAHMAHRERVFRGELVFGGERGWRASVLVRSGGMWGFAAHDGRPGGTVEIRLLGRSARADRVRTSLCLARLDASARLSPFEGRFWFDT